MTDTAPTDWREFCAKLLKILDESQEHGDDCYPFIQTGCSCGITDIEQGIRTLAAHIEELEKDLERLAKLWSWMRWEEGASAVIRIPEPDVPEAEKLTLTEWVDLGIQAEGGPPTPPAPPPADMDGRIEGDQEEC